MTRSPNAASELDQGTGPSCRAHGVEVYSSDASLTAAVTEFVQPALQSGVALIIATPDHRDAFTAALQASGVDVVAANGSGRLVLLDADATMARFMDDDGPRVAVFNDVIGSLLDAAEQRGGPVRVYGEMVAVLWERGRVAEAMALEQLWNELAGTCTFELLCGYPAALFTADGSADAFSSLCGQHILATLPPDQSLTRLAAAAVGTNRADERVVRWRLPAELTSGAASRNQLREVLGSWRRTDVLNEATLLATELVNNAVIHAGSPVLVSATLREHAVQVEVTDGGAGAFHRLNTDLGATSGRGLQLVEAMSTAWGTLIDGESKTVWFEVRGRPQG